LLPSRYARRGSSHTWSHVLSEDTKSAPIREMSIQNEREEDMINRFHLCSLKQRRCKDRRIAPLMEGLPIKIFFCWGIALALLTLFSLGPPAIAQDGLANLLFPVAPSDTLKIAKRQCPTNLPAAEVELGSNGLATLFLLDGGPGLQIGSGLGGRGCPTSCRCRGAGGGSCAPFSSPIGDGTLRLCGCTGDCFDCRSATSLLVRLNQLDNIVNLFSEMGLSASTIGPN
jgi:hypothetical protein